jgi:hypothetical protein
MEEKLTTNISNNVDLCNTLVEILNTNFILIYWPYESQWHMSTVHYLGETIILDTYSYDEPTVEKYTTDELQHIKKLTLSSGCIIYNDLHHIVLSNILLFAINAHINTCIYIYNYNQYHTTYTQLLTLATSLKPILNTLLKHKSIRTHATTMSICIFDMIDLIKLHTNTMLIHKKNIDVKLLISSISNVYHIDDLITTIYTDEIRFKQLLIYLINGNAIIIVTIDSDDHVVFDIKPDNLLSAIHLNICDKLSHLLRCTLSIIDDRYLLVV